MNILKEFSVKQIFIVVAGLAIAIGALFVPEAYVKMVGSVVIVSLAVMLAKGK